MVGDDTHYKKHEPCCIILNRGGIPIEKNIYVVDEQGNEYEATYRKRAKGLVKNGRARFVSENKICLACPPNKILEDNIMNNIDENIKIKIEQGEQVAEIEKKEPAMEEKIAEIEKKEPAMEEKVAEIEKKEPAMEEKVAEIEKKEFVIEQKTVEIDEKTSIMEQNIDDEINSNKLLSVDYILKRIEQISSENSHISSAISELRQTDLSVFADSRNTCCSDKFQALANIVNAKEQSNQRLLDFYMKIYDDLTKTSKSTNNIVSNFDDLTNWMKNVVWDELNDEAKLILRESLTSQLSRHF